MSSILLHHKAQNGRWQRISLLSLSKLPLVGGGEHNCRFIVVLTSEHCSGWRTEQRRMISSTANVNKRWRPVTLLCAGQQIPHIPSLPLVNAEIKDARYVWQSSGRFSWIEGMCWCESVCVYLFVLVFPSNLVSLAPQLSPSFLDKTLFTFGNCSKASFWWVLLVQVGHNLF